MYSPDHETILASLLGAVVVIDSGQRIRYVNPAAEALLERPRAGLLDAPIAAVLERAEWVLTLVERVHAQRGVSVRAEGRLTPGSEDDIVAVASPLADGRERNDYVVLVLHNLGPRQRLLTDELARSRLADLDNLVAGVGHEINNPLSGIRGAAQFLGKKLAERPELGQYADMIVRQSDRMADLVRVLMELEAPAPEMSAVNIHRILNEVLLLVRSEAGIRGVEFVTRFDPSLPEVHGNADSLEQLFLNLFKNAVAACPPRSGAVSVATRIENRYHVETGERRLRYIAVDVVDNGAGIEQEALEQIFTPFFSRTPGGHGLGLAIARNIVTAHHGQLKADNASGLGARFRVTLPVAEDSGEQARGA
ncbi:MAG: ATP-binding protein [Candidatus Binatia bacterium]